MAELVSAAGFQRDRLYVEWQLQFDPELWVLQHSEQEVVQPGLIQVRVCRQVRGALACMQHVPVVVRGSSLCCHTVAGYQWLVGCSHILFAEQLSVGVEQRRWHFSAMWSHIRFLCEH